MASALLQAMKKCFPDLSSMSAVTSALQSTRKAKIPLVSFQSPIPTAPLSTLIDSTCNTLTPDSQEKLVQATKRLRKFLSINEETACSKCSLRGTCPFQGKPAVGPQANTLDLAKVMYALTHVKNLPAEQETAAIEVINGLDSALQKSSQVPESSYRVLRNIHIPEVIQAISRTKQPPKPRKVLTDRLKWNPSSQQLQHQEQMWTRRESKSALQRVMKTVRELFKDRKSGKSPRKHHR